MTYEEAEKELYRLNQELYQIIGPKRIFSKGDNSDLCLAYVVAALRKCKLSPEPLHVSNLGKDHDVMMKITRSEIVPLLEWLEELLEHRKLGQ